MTLWASSGKQSKPVPALVSSFHRWSRSIIELLIHRNEGDDLENALAHIQKARTVAEEFKPEVSLVVCTMCLSSLTRRRAGTRLGRAGMVACDELEPRLGFPQVSTSQYNCLTLLNRRTVSRMQPAKPDCGWRPPSVSARWSRMAKNA